MKDRKRNRKKNKIHHKIYRFLVIFIFIIILLCITVGADEIIDIKDFDLKDAQKIIDESEYTEIDFAEMVKRLFTGQSTGVLSDTAEYMFGKVFNDVNIAKECVANIFVITIFAAFFSNFANVFTKSRISDSGFYICYIAVMTILITMFSITMNIATEVINLVLQFMQAFIPAFFLSMGITYQAAALGFYQITIVAIYAVEIIFSKVIVPALKIYLLLSVTNGISKDDMLSKGIELLKKGIFFLNKVMLSVIFGINIMEGLLTPQLDNLKNTAIKKLAGALPIVGDGKNYITNVFINSGILIKNSIGTAAIIIIVCLCAIPLIKIWVSVISLKIVTAIVQPVTDKRLTECISDVSEGIGILLKCLFTIIVLFVLSIAIVCMMTTFK